MDFVNFASRALAVIFIALGFVLLIGAPERTSAPAWRPMLDVARGEIWPYALAWLAAGAMMLTNSKARFYGLILGCLSANMWAALFLVAIFKYPDASATGTIAYGGYGLLTALILGFVITRRRPPAKSKGG